MKNKNVVITGTSRGIGFELVHKFLELDYHVLALSRNNQLLANDSLENLHAFTFDLCCPEDYQALPEFIHDEFNGCVDILIHNAGNLILKPFEEISAKELEYVYEVNVFGPAR
ncbi:MAG: SDR family NAD(P)-dependent oxidoreductase, partial [Flavobacteriaceae bacterium]|nr:SDR family NAD(P)-dependent oxidoreductase [Flavobacteriaceae bacterium]